MKRRTKWIAAGATTVVLLGAGTGVAVAAGSGGDDGGDTPITGAALEHASAVALTSTGGGRVTGTEVNDEESYYQVEVTLDNGKQVDVQLDAQFKVVGSKTDHEEERRTPTAEPDLRSDLPLSEWRLRRECSPQLLR